MITAYDLAREQFAHFDVDTESALATLATIPISLHCWQGDDVTGFENPGELTGGIMATGNYPGKARNGEELRADLDKTLSLIPGSHRINLHAIYAETDGKDVPRNELTADHFSRWIDWATSRTLGMDFNSSNFSHPLADDGLTLSHPDPAIRQFWIEHSQACRRIAAAMGEATGTPAILNTWVPDGYKDIPADRGRLRQNLLESLDAMRAEALPAAQMRDAVECKLFGLGSESYVVGSHEFYMGYAVTRDVLLCLDAGHFHPTEVISDKISSALLYMDELLLHVSRPVRWDSDHVVILDDELRAIAREIVTGGYLSRVHIGLDFFDASINRLAAWTIGTRAMIQALLIALLELPALKVAEHEGDFTARLALMEQTKAMPWAVVWDEYCTRQNVPVGLKWLGEVKQYETSVLSQR